MTQGAFAQIWMGKTEYSTYWRERVNPISVPGGSEEWGSGTQCTGYTGTDGASHDWGTRGDWGDTDFSVTQWLTMTEQPSFHSVCCSMAFHQHWVGASIDNPTLENENDVA